MTNSGDSPRSARPDVAIIGWACTLRPIRQDRDGNGR